MRYAPKWEQQERDRERIQNKCSDLQPYICMHEICEITNGFKTFKELGKNALIWVHMHRDISKYIFVLMSSIIGF
jgi:hypothetical protein